MTDTQVEVHLDRLGTTYTQVPRLTISSDFTTPCDSFEFDLVDLDPKKLRGLEGEPCTITVNGAQQLIGRIERRRVGRNGATNTFQGRDYLSGIAGGQLRKASVKDREDVYTVIQRVAAPWGIKEIASDEDIDMREVRSGRSKVNGKVPIGIKTAKHSDFDSREGEGVLQYLIRIVTRHGATIQPADARHKLLIQVPNFDQDPSYELTRLLDGSGGDTIIEAESQSAWDTVPTSVTAKGFAGGSKEARQDISHNYDYFSGLLHLYAPELLQKITDVFQTDYIPPGTLGDPLKMYRHFFYEDSEARDPSQLERSMFRMVAEHLKETLTYSATVRGIKDERSGRIWTVNTVAQVYDEVADVTENMWVIGRDLDVSVKGGDIAKLKMIRLGTLRL